MHSGNSTPRIRWNMVGWNERAGFRHVDLHGNATTNRQNLSFALESWVIKRADSVERVLSERHSRLEQPLVAGWNGSLLMERSREQLQVRQTDCMNMNRYALAGFWFEQTDGLEHARTHAPTPLHLLFPTCHPQEDGYRGLCSTSLYTSCFSMLLHLYAC